MLEPGRRLLFLFSQCVTHNKQVRQLSTGSAAPTTGCQTFTDWQSELSAATTSAVTTAASTTSAERHIDCDESQAESAACR